MNDDRIKEDMTDQESTTEISDLFKKNTIKEKIKIEGTEEKMMRQLSSCSPIAKWFKIIAKSSIIFILV